MVTQTVNIESGADFYYNPAESTDLDPMEDYPAHIAQLERGTVVFTYSLGCASEWFTVTGGIGGIAGITYGVTEVITVWVGKTETHVFDVLAPDPIEHSYGLSLTEGVSMCTVLVPRVGMPGDVDNATLIQGVEVCIYPRHL